MPDVGFPSFDQLHVLTAIAEAGSFSAAARKLNRAQSVISYSVAQLEEQLGVVLFDRTGRLPKLTDAGRSLLADARKANGAMDALRARAAALQKGLEPELRVGVDVMFPTPVLIKALEAFAAAFPTVGLRLCIEALGGVAQLVSEQACDFGISTELSAMPEAIRQRPIGSVLLIPVAAPTYLLAGSADPIGREAVRDATQIVLTDRTSFTQGRDLAVLSAKTWRIGDLGAKHALLRAGLGWGNMPEFLVRDDLVSGRMVRLRLTEGRDHTYPLSLIHRDDRSLGPAAAWLAQRLSSGLEAKVAEAPSPATIR